MEDYQTIIKEMLGQHFSPTGNGEATPYSTPGILKMVRGVIPGRSITENDIFSILTEMGFQKDLHPIYEQDISGKKTENIIGYIYLWSFYKIGKL